MDIVTYVMAKNNASPTIEGADIKSTNTTSGKVLTADGSGGASWQTAGGGGSGDVTASGTLTNNSIILGDGTKSVKAMATTRLGHFLQCGQNEPEWKGLYQHFISLYYPGDDFSGEIILRFSVISTYEFEYDSLTSIPDGYYVATGDYNDTFNGNGHCNVLSFNTINNEVSYWATNDASVSAAVLTEVLYAEILDSVRQIA